MRRRAGYALIALLAGAAPARGDGSDELRALATATLSRAAAGLGAARAAVLPSHDGVAVSVGGEAPAALSAALAESLAAEIRADGGRAAVLSTGPDDALRESARAAGMQRVLRVTLAPEATGVSVSTAAQRARAGAWESFLAEPPMPPAVTAEAVTVALSAAIRARFGMPTRPPWPASGIVRHRTIPTPFRAVVALALGIVAGSPALAIATTDALRVARLEARTLSFLPGSWSLAGLGSVAAPARQPLGAMVWDAQGIHLRTSAQSHAGLVALEGAGLAGSVRSEGEGWPGVDGALRVDPLAARLSGGVDPVMRAAFPSARGALRVDCDGAGACAVRVSGVVQGTLRDVAPPALIEDLDEDGAPEVLLASASAPDAPDRVRVFAVREGGIQERASISAPGPVLAMCAGAAPEGRALVVAARDTSRGAVTLLLVP